MGIYAQVKDCEGNTIGLWQPLRQLFFLYNEMEAKRFSENCLVKAQGNRDLTPFFTPLARCA